MTMSAFQHDMGAFTKEIFADALDVIAGGGLDGVAQNGEIIDRLATAKFGDAAALGLSAVLVVSIEATLAATETATVAIKTQDGAISNLSDAADFGTAPTDLVLTGGGGGTVERGVIRQKLDLGSAKQFMRSVITVTISTASVDVGLTGAVYVFGGFDELPVS